MKKIVFFCIPAHGHTNPTLGVVRELVQRGHQVWYYSYEMFREKIQETGAMFVPCDGYDMEQKLTPQEAARMGNDLVLSTRVLVDTTLALDEPVCREMERLQPDCIVADSMAIWGKAIAKKLGIPFVSSTTTFAFNEHSAKTMDQGLGELMKFLISIPKVHAQIKRLRKKNYPIRNVLDILQNDAQTDTIVYTSSSFQPFSETFPREHYSFVGPSIRDASYEIEKTRQKLVYLSMGSVNNAMLPLYQACIQAFAQTDYQVILAVGTMVKIADFGDLPQNVSVFPHVDQIAVLQKADVFLSHCGMNSVSEALYFGVPLVMLPKTAEQTGVAARVEQMGAGILLQKEDPASILEAVNQVLRQPSYAQNAGKISADFRACSGVKGAADKILSCCK